MFSSVMASSYFHSGKSYDEFQVSPQYFFLLFHLNVKDQAHKVYMSLFLYTQSGHHTPYLIRVRHKQKQREKKLPALPFDMLWCHFFLLVISEFVNW